MKKFDRTIGIGFKFYELYINENNNRYWILWEVVGFAYGEGSGGAFSDWKSREEVLSWMPPRVQLLRIPPKESNTNFALEWSSVDFLTTMFERDMNKPVQEQRYKFNDSVTITIDMNSY